MSKIPVTSTATFCATIVDQWVSLGLSDAFIGPGSRSTPLALAVIANPDLDAHLFHDERSASFACLGHGLATHRPGLLFCTSGTAATHFHGAIVEADASDVPMLVCTADRPPELWGVGAPQTINQTELYGDAVRLFAEPGPPDETDPAFWRSLAMRTFEAALGASVNRPASRPGPVHLNLSFRDPLVGLPGPLPPPVADFGPKGTSRPAFDGSLPELGGQTGVIIAGRSGAPPADVIRLAEVLDWPLLADHRSGCRAPGLAITHFDTLLRDPNFASASRPDVIIRVGEPLASKVLGQRITSWAAEGTQVIALTDHGKTIDPERVASITLPVEDALPALMAAARSSTARLSTTRLSEAVPFRSDRSWATRWMEANATIERLTTALLDESPELTEVGVARAVVEAVPPTGALVVSSSMPIRDVEWFGPNRNDITVYANRGANGIDGVTSTAIGVALTGVPTFLLIGDVAFLHDSNGLIGLRNRKLDLTIVVIDNDGGGIFSFLPQHDQLPNDDYEFLFGTPHGTNLAELCGAHGLEARPWTSTLPPPSGVEVVIATTNRNANLALHHRLSALTS